MPATASSERCDLLPSGPENILPVTFAAGKFAKFLPSATFAMAVESLMGLSDSIVCGHILGEDGLSAVNLMQPVFNTVSFFALLAGTGTSVLYGRATGRFDRRRAGELLTQGLWTALGFGLALACALALGRNAATAAFGVSGSVLAGVRSYWAWFVPCAVLEPLAFFFTSMCYQDGDGRTSSIAYAAQLLGNCALSIPLTMRYGYAGCAAGTALGHLAALSVLLLHFRRPGNSLSFAWHFSLKDTRLICTCAFGDAGIRLCQAGLMLALNVYTVARFGADRLPVLAAALAVLGISEAFDGVATAAQPLACVYIGERNGRLVRRIMRLAAIVSTAEGAALTLLLAAFPGLLTSLIGISDPALAASAHKAVRIVSLGLTGTSLVMLMNSYYTFRVREGLAFAATALSSFVLPAAFFPVAGAFSGETGVWTVLAASPYAAIVLIALYVAVKDGRGAFPLLLEKEREKKIRVFDLGIDPDSVCAAAAAVEEHLEKEGAGPQRASKASLLVEETLMTVSERNAGKRTKAEVSVEFDGGTVTLAIRDDGTIFDITDADARVSSLRSYLVSNLMTAIPRRRNLTATGFNRNLFKL